MNQSHEPFDPASAATSTPSPLCPIPRNGLPRSAGLVLSILLTLAATLLGTGIPLMRLTAPTAVYIAEGVFLVGGLVLLIHLWRVSRAVKGLGPVLLLIGLSVTVLFRSAIPAAMLLSLIFAVGEGSILLSTIDRRRATWLPLIPLIAYMLTVLVSRDLVGSLAALVPFPAMLVLAFGTRQSAARKDGLTRVGVLCATSFALGISLLGIIALALYRLYDSLSPDVLLPVLNQFRESLILSITQGVIPADTPEEMKPLIDLIMRVLLVSQLTEEMRAVLTYELTANLVNGTINTFPGLFVAALNILTAISQLVLLTGLTAFGYGASLTERVRLFRLSLVSCLVFAASYFILMFTADSPSTLALSVAECLYIILLPGLALAGVLRLAATLARRGTRNMGCLFYLVIIIPCLFLIAPFVLAIYEVIAHIYSAILSRLRPPEA